MCVNLSITEMASREPSGLYVQEKVTSSEVQRQEKKEQESRMSEPTKACRSQPV